MGITYKIIRTLIAVIILGFYFTNAISGTLGIILIVLSVIFLLTSLVSFCPFYAIFGISTKPKGNKA
jgi:hypothetical protein